MGMSVVQRQRVASHLRRLIASKKKKRPNRHVAPCICMELFFLLSLIQYSVPMCCCWCLLVMLRVRLCLRVFLCFLKTL